MHAQQHKPALQKKAAAPSTAYSPGAPVAQPARTPAWASALPLQTKLTINQPGDIYEQEADEVAERVMRMPEPRVQRKCACGGEAGPDGECEACKARRLGVQRKADGAAGGEAPASVHETLRRSGQTLDASTRGFMESRFGADFGGVRVHTDARAAESARDVSARAYTVGRDVAFGAGEFAPGTLEGDRLIAHELTHVVQQEANPHQVQRDGAVIVTPVAYYPLIQRQINKARQAANDWYEQGSFALAGYFTRYFLLLENRDSSSVADDASAQAFIDRCGALATGMELNVLAELRLGLAVLDEYPEAFPVTWASRVAQALLMPADIGELRERQTSLRENLNRVGERVPDGIIDRGLPVSFDEVQSLRRFELTLRHLRIPGNHVVKDFAMAARDLTLVMWPIAFLTIWDGMLTDITEMISRGERVVDPGNYYDFVATQRSGLDSFNQRLQAIRTEGDIAAWDTEFTDLFRVAFIQSFGATIGSLVMMMAQWLATKQPFNQRLSEVDQRIAAATDNERAVMAMRWAWHSGYFGAAAEQLLSGLIENLPTIIGLTILFIIIQFIPGLNILVDIAVVIYSGIDAIDALASIREAFVQAQGARTPEAMQRAAARIAASLEGDGLRLFLDIVAIVSGIRSTRSNVTRLLRTNPAMTEEQAVRQALRESNPRRRATAEPEPPRRPSPAEPEPQGRPSEATREPRRPGEPPEVNPNSPRPTHPDLQPFCFLGSLYCPQGIPLRVRNRVGEYPLPNRVPYPGGSLYLRGTTDPVYVALRRIRAAAMRDAYVQQPRLWTPEFEAAYNTRRLRWGNEDPETWWPRVGDRKNVGPRWQVHHRRPLDFGGDNVASNYVPLEPDIHSLYTNWWSGLKREISSYFTDAEWNRLIGGNKNRIYTPSDF